VLRTEVERRAPVRKAQRAAGIRPEDNEQDRHDEREMTMSEVDWFLSIPRDQRAMFAERFVKRYLDPSFGSMTKSEIDLLVFSLLFEVGAIAQTESLYTIARHLRITPSRARTLKMRAQLRDTTQTEEHLRRRIVECLSHARFAKEGALVMFGVEDPLLQEDIGARLKKIGATADSSFNREIVRIQIDAFVDFIADLLPDDRRELVRKALIKAGMDDTSLKGVLLGALAKLADKIAGRAAGALAKEVGELAGAGIKVLFGSAEGAITATWKSLLKSD
jgi:hypothetical protein